MKTKKLLSILLVLCMLISVFPMTSITACAGEDDADPVSVSYIDVDGIKKTVTAKPLVDDGTITLTDGWYVVGKDTNKDEIIDETDHIGEDVTYIRLDGVVVKGEVNLIFADGFCLEITGMVIGIVVEGKDSSLTFYDQGQDYNYWSCLDVITSESAAIRVGGNGYGSLTVNGGNIQVKVNEPGHAAIGGSSGEDGGSVIINDGSVTAYAAGNAAVIGGGYNGSGSNIVINGGSVTALINPTPATIEEFPTLIGIGIGGMAGAHDISIYGGTVAATGYGDIYRAIGAIKTNDNSNIWVQSGNVIRYSPDYDYMPYKVLQINNEGLTDISKALTDKAMITVNMEPRYYSLSTSQGEGGSIEIEKQNYAAGEIVFIDDTSPEGMELEKLYYVESFTTEKIAIIKTDLFEDDHPDGQRGFIMPKSHVMVYATFRKTPDIPVQSITVEQEVLAMAPGETTTVSVTVLPNDATYKNVVWKSNNDSVVKVDPYTGEITAVGTGTAYITVFDMGVSIEKTIKVFVNESMKLSNTELYLGLDYNYTLKATVFPEKQVSQEVTWSSSDESIVTVIDGFLTPVSVGDATVTATSTETERTATCMVHVCIPVNKITIEGIDGYSHNGIHIGETKTVAVEIYPENATYKGIVWSSDDESIAKVDQNGIITGVSAGVSKIIASSSDGYAITAFNLTVKGTVCKIGNKAFESVNEAVDSVEGDEMTTVTLISDSNERNLINIDVGKHITLDLNGHVLRSTIYGERGSEFIVVDRGKTVRYFTDEMCEHGISVGNDCTDCKDKVAISDGAYESYTTKRPEDMSGVLTVTGGCIIGSHDDTLSGNVTLNGGNIIGGKKAGIRVGETVTVNGGSIVGNRVGVFTNNSSSILYLCSGVISHNIGGGIVFEIFSENVTAKINVSGGIISNNGSEELEYGGGISSGMGVSIAMSGGSVINNKAILGGGISCEEIITISGGEIAYNKSKIYGGGIYAEGGVYMSGGSIYNNTTEGTGGGVFSFGKYIIGGSAKIYGNHANIGDNLSVIPLAGYLSIGTESEDNGTGAVPVPTDQMFVGISILNLVDINNDNFVFELGNGQFTTNGTTGNEKYFFSDSSDYAVAFNDVSEGNDYLELVPIDDTTIPDVVHAEYYASLTLKDNIDINFKMKGLADFEGKLDKLSILVDGTPIASDKLALNDNNSEVSCILKAVAPKEMSKSIHVVVMYDGKVIKGFDYSIRKYCEAVFDAYKDADKTTTEGKLYDLCEAVLNYGKWAEDYFNEKDGNASAAASELNAGHVIDFSNVSIPKESVNFTSSNLVENAEAYLSLGTKDSSSMSLNFNIYTTKEITKDNIQILNNLNQAVNSDNIVVEELTKKDQDQEQEKTVGYTVKITNIGASKLSRKYTIKFSDIEDAFSITYGIYDYCYSAQDQTGEKYTDKLKTLCKAIYLYGEAAKAYTGSIQ